MRASFFCKKPLLNYHNYAKLTASKIAQKKPPRKSGIKKPKENIVNST